MAQRGVFVFYRWMPHFNLQEAPLCVQNAAACTWTPVAALLKSRDTRAGAEPGTALLLVNVSDIPQPLVEDITRAFGGAVLLCRYNDAGEARSAIAWLPDHEPIEVRPDGEPITLQDMLDCRLGDVLTSVQQCVLAMDGVFTTGIARKRYTQDVTQCERAVRARIA